MKLSTALSAAALVLSGFSVGAVSSSFAATPPSSSAIFYACSTGKTGALGHLSTKVISCPAGTSLVSWNASGSQPNQVPLLPSGVKFVNDYLLAPNQKLTSANLSNTNLTGIDLQNSWFEETDLSNSNLSYANLTNDNFSSSNLSGVTLTGANLTGAALNGLDLSGVSLAHANLANAYLDGANLTRADLTGAINYDLSGTIRTGAICPNGIVSGKRGANC